MREYDTHIEKTLDLGVYSVSSCEYTAFQLFLKPEVRIPDPLCRLSLRPVSDIKKPMGQLLTLTLFLSAGALRMPLIQSLVDSTDKLL